MKCFTETVLLFRMEFGVFSALEKINFNYCLCFLFFFIFKHLGIQNEEIMHIHQGVSDHRSPHLPFLYQ